MFKYILVMIICNVTFFSRLCDFVNVGTVLFHDYDSDTDCWSYDRVGLLTARKIMQQLIPEKLIKLHDDTYISAFIEYASECFRVLNSSVSGLPCHQHQGMVVALADVIGGYLNTYLLPMTKKSYYYGNIRYDEAKNLFTLFEEMKSVLRTDGTSWKSPLDTGKKNLKIRPLRITPPPPTEDACIDFEVCEDNTAADSKINKLNIPMPILDDQKSPHSIALPLKKFSLYSVFDQSSRFLLVRYYVASTKCLLSRKLPHTDIINYNRKLQIWLKEAVLPLLKDSNTWYPAFGGVFKILQTMKRLKINAEPEFLRPLSKYGKVQRSIHVNMFYDSLNASNEHSHTANHNGLVPVEPLELHFNAVQKKQVDELENVDHPKENPQYVRSFQPWLFYLECIAIGITALFSILFFWICFFLIIKGRRSNMKLRTYTDEDGIDENQNSSTPDKPKLVRTDVQVYYSLMQSASGSCETSDTVQKESSKDVLPVDYEQQLNPFSNKI